LARPALTVGLLVTCTVIDRHGECPVNLALITAGTLGMLLGSLPASVVNCAARWLPFTLPAYVVHSLIGLKLGQPFLHQMIGALLAVVVLYGLAILAAVGRVAD
jgi:hypothetical protein